MVKKGLEINRRIEGGFTCRRAVQLHVYHGVRAAGS